MSNWAQKDGEENKNSNEEMRSFMLKRFAHLVSLGGSELEEKLKMSSSGNPLFSFVCSKDPDHALYKQKIAEYIESPPPLDPDPTPDPPKDHLPDSQGRYRVLPPRTVSSYTFMVRIPKGMMRKELGVIKFTAQFVARYGYEFWVALRDRVCTETQFQFLKKNDVRDERYKFPSLKKKSDERDGMSKFQSLKKSEERDAMSKLFPRLCLGYTHVIKTFVEKPRKSDTARMEAVVEGYLAAFDAFKRKQEKEEDEVMEEVVTDRRDFVVSDEYFVDIERKELPPRDSLQTFQFPMWMMMQYMEQPDDPCLDPNTFRVGIPQGMMRKELGTIKFTAQFVARYGSDFWDALRDRVCTDDETEFQFLKRNPGNDDRGRCTLFSRFLLAYGSVIKPWPSHPEAVVEGFLAAFDAFKKKQEEEEEDEVVEKGVTDRSDFVVSDEYFFWQQQLVTNKRLLKL